MCLNRTSMVCLVAVGLLGCRRDQAGAKAGSDRQPRSPEWEIRRPAPATSISSERPLSVALEPTLVRRGALPLVYMVESSVGLTVTDLTTGVRVARGSVGPHTIVRVEARKGVLLNSQQLAHGPLPADHEYGIYVAVDGPSLIRTESIGPSTGPIDGGPR